MTHHATQQVHAGYEPEVPCRPVAVPIHRTAAYRVPDHATAASVFRLETPGFTDSRTGNPTVAVFENRLAALEGGIGAIGTATGRTAGTVAEHLARHPTVGRVHHPAIPARPGPVSTASPPRPGEPAARRPGPTSSGQRRGCQEHD
ncbi:PLP-dependent transferase [Kocuria flava]|uniref:PLP-dependent transferase n=1 Tax=Kocuria flava TaxID=446860 RepID=UPI002F91E011